MRTDPSTILQDALASLTSPSATVEAPPNVGFIALGVLGGGARASHLGEWRRAEDFNAVFVAGCLDAFEVGWWGVVEVA